MEGLSLFIIIPLVAMLLVGALAFLWRVSRVLVYSRNTNVKNNNNNNNNNNNVVVKQPQTYLVDSDEQKLRRMEILDQLQLQRAKEQVERQQTSWQEDDEEEEDMHVDHYEDEDEEDGKDELRPRGALGDPTAQKQPDLRQYQKHMPDPRRIYSVMEGYDELEQHAGYELRIDEDAGDPHGKLGGDGEHGRVREGLNMSALEIAPSLGDFNSRFQKILRNMDEFTTQTPLRKRIRAGRNLINLSMDFVESAKAYGKLIISEFFLKDEEKTIPPNANLGGIAGGTKYLVRNIMFKFAVDSRQMFGSDHVSQKVAGHELKGLTAMFNASANSKANQVLHYPLVALVDYRGYRLIAESILPISDDTIIYGSCDYGMTIHKSDAERDAEFVEAIERVSEALNIKRHYCGVKGHRPVLLRTPVDLEGHRGADGHYYLLDFSRVMPPELPRKGVHMSHMFRLLRGELLKRFPKPLCSDGFSNFIKNHSAKEHNMELAQATKYLVDDIIPDFGPRLQEAILHECKAVGWASAFEKFRLSEALHREGINIRYVGHVRAHVVNSDVRTLLMIEMLARVVKNLLRLLLRERMRELKVPMEEPYRRLCIDYLNLVLGDSERSELYWNTVIKEHLISNFDRALSNEESQDKEFFLKAQLTNFSSLKVDGKWLLFKRVCDMCGLIFSSSLLIELQENPNSWTPFGAEPFDDTDLVEIAVRTKHMNIVTYYQGVVYLERANEKWSTDVVVAERLLKMARTKFEEALDADPNNQQTLAGLGEVGMKLLECQHAALERTKIHLESPQARRVKQYFERAILQGTNTNVLFLYAVFLEKCGELQDAEEFYLRALEANPRNEKAIFEYANFLQERGAYDLAEMFLAKLPKK